MSDHDVLYGFGLQSLSSHHGASAIYTPADGTGDVSLENVLIGVESHEEVDAHDGLKERIFRLVTLVTDSSNPNYSGIEEPLPNASVTLAGVVYAVDSVRVGPQYGQATIKLVRRTQKEKTRPNYRKSI
jgi:hypothetical protein